MIMQCYFFETEEVRQLRQEVQELKSGQSNMRRGLFARHNELERLTKELREELNAMKQINARKKAELVPFFGELMEMSK